MSVSRAMEILTAETTGPLGGNLHNPVQNPSWRRTPLNADVEPVTGLPFLHQKEFVDTAVAGRKDEQAWNRMAAFMLLAGRTNSEIALAAGVTPQTVSKLRAQRWFQELLAVLANEQGQDIRGLVASEAAASLQKLVDLRDHAESERIQLAAATTLFEQAAGKPVQKTLSVTASTTFASEKDEFDAIQTELANIRNQK